MTAKLLRDSARNRRSAQVQKAGATLTLSKLLPAAAYMPHWDGYGYRTIGHTSRRDGLNDRYRRQNEEVIAYGVYYR